MDLCDLLLCHPLRDPLLFSLHVALSVRSEGLSGYEEYFLSRRKWFFGFLAATYVADIVDTALKGSAYVHSFGIEYPIRITLGLIICSIGMFVRNRRVQFVLLTTSLLYQIHFILRLYSTE